MAKISTTYAQGSGTVITHRQGTGGQHHKFGVFDRKGRELGCYVGFVTHTFAPIDANAGLGYSYGTSMPAGDMLGMRPQATRNGEGYGAGQDVTYYATEAERLEAAAAYVKGARARAIARAAKEANR